MPMPKQGFFFNPSFFKNKMQMNRRNGKKCCVWESTPLGSFFFALTDGPRTGLEGNGMERVPSLCPPPHPLPEKSFFGDLQPHGWGYLHHPKEETHKTRESLLNAMLREAWQAGEGTISVPMPQRQNPKGGHRSKASSRDQQDR